MYDAVGNRTSSHLSASYTTGTFNKLTATSWATYAYNNNGSTTGKVAGAFDWTYGWDRESRMVSATVVNGRDPVYYAYDALGRRVKRSLGSVIDKYTYDGQDVVRDDDSGVARTYQNGPGIDNKLKYNASNGARYFMQDHLGSTIGTANATGIRRNVNTYDSYGNPSDPNYQYRYQFTGREYDSFTGLQYSRARFYDPQVGRFISEDPIGFGGGDVNLYGYVKNRPLRNIDPFGKDIVGVGVGAGGFLGAGEGSGGSVSTLTGYSTEDHDLLMAGSYGGFTPFCNNGMAIGGGAYAGWGGFWSNARNRQDLEGEFDTYQFGFGPFGSFEFDFGTTPDNRKIRVVQVSPPFIGGIGTSVGYTNYKTFTDPRGIISSNQISSDLAREIGNLYGNKGCNCP